MPKTDVRFWGYSGPLQGLTFRSGPDPGCV